MNHFFHEIRTGRIAVCTQRIGIADNAAGPPDASQYAHQRGQVIYAVIVTDSAARHEKEGTDAAQEIQIPVSRHGAGGDFPD